MRMKKISNEKLKIGKIEVLHNLFDSTFFNF